MFDGQTDDVALKCSILVNALRGELPKTYRWDFSFIHRPATKCCRSAGCALGLPIELGLATIDDVQFYGDICQTFGITPEQTAVFEAWEVGGIVPLYGIPASQITPAMVADKIEEMW
jgi:hypothetical protein